MIKYQEMSQIFPLTQATSIALRCMVAIVNAKNSMNIDDLSVITSSSRHHVAKVLSRLVKKELIASRRGPHGGFYLIEKPSHITLWNIFEATEGKFDYKSYKLERNWNANEGLPDSLPEEISYHFIAFLKSKKLSHYKRSRKTVLINDFSSLAGWQS